MVKEKKNGPIEEKDLFNIFMDGGSSQFESQLLKSKKKLLNAKRGKNELFEILKLKSKGLDMIILILENNKELIRKEDINCLETLASLLRLARNEKSLFDTISKKVKTIVTLVLKNQILLNKEEKFEDICKFIFELMNIQFENSFLQQVIDKMKTNQTIFFQFTEILFSKFFKGRNISIKINDLKYMIKYTFSFIGPHFYLEKLINYLVNKDKGGARTTHQVNQVFNLLTYIIELTNNKLNDDSSSEFKQKFMTDYTKEMNLFSKKIMEVVKENLKGENVNEKETEVKTNDVDEKNLEEKEEITTPTTTPVPTKSKKEQTKKANDLRSKNNYFFIGLIIFYERYLTSLIKSTKIDENLNKITKKILNILEKIVEKYELKNMDKKIKEIKEKVEEFSNK